jgi:hypothetical protein
LTVKVRGVFQAAASQEALRGSMLTSSYVRGTFASAYCRAKASSGIGRAVAGMSVTNFAMGAQWRYMSPFST